jgi:hypothetical protein
LTKEVAIKDLIISAGDYVLKDIPIQTFPEGISFAYTHKSKGVCYNASLLAMEILIKRDMLLETNENKKRIDSAANYVLSKQQNSGVWYYSYNSKTKEERKQIDFHQGFVLDSLGKYYQYTGNQSVRNAISKGLDYYKNEQFFSNGRSLRRVPRIWPVDIHNQAQGIITFSKFSNYDEGYLPFAQQIAKYTIKHMQDSKGYFYYQIHKHFVNKIPYIRWAQAWMLLALSHVKLKLDND